MGHVTYKKVSIKMDKLSQKKHKKEMKRKLKRKSGLTSQKFNYTLTRKGMLAR